MQAKVEELKTAIFNDLQIIKEVGNVPEATLQSIIGDDLKLFLAEGGRVMKSTGGDMASETPTEPVATKLIIGFTDPDPETFPASLTVTLTVGLFLPVKLIFTTSSATIYLLL